MKPLGQEHVLEEHDVLLITLKHLPLIRVIPGWHSRHIMFPSSLVLRQFWALNDWQNLAPAGTEPGKYEGREPKGQFCIWFV